MALTRDTPALLLAAHLFNCALMGQVTVSSPNPSFNFDVSNPIPIDQSGQNPQSVTITSSAGTISLVATSSLTVGNWLRFRLNPQSSTCPDQVQLYASYGQSFSLATPARLCVLAVAPQNMARGTYAGYVTLTSGIGAGTPVAQVKVNLTAFPSEYIVVTPLGGTVFPVGVDKTLPRFQSVNGQVPLGQTLQVDIVDPNTGKVARPYSVSKVPVGSDPADWLIVSGGPSYLMTSTRPPASMFTVSIDPSLAPAGDSTAIVRLTSTAPYASVVDININASVTKALPSIVNSPVTLAYPEGPLSTSIPISGAGAFTTSATSDDNTGWLQVNPPSGTTPQTGILTISARVDDTRRPGTYTGSVNFTPTGGNQATVRVTLNVVGLKLSTQNIPLSCVAGGKSAAQLLTVSSTDASPLAFTATPNSPWIKLSQTAGTTNANLSISADCAGLTQPSYTGTVTFVPNGAGTGPQATVMLTVSPPVTNPVTPANVTLSYDLSGYPPGQLSQRVSISGAGITSFSTSPSVAWLHANPSSGTGAGSVVISADAPLDPSATPLTGKVTFNYVANGIAGRQDVTVNLNVSGAKSIVPIFLDGVGYQTTLQLAGAASADAGYWLRFWQSGSELTPGNVGPAPPQGIIRAQGSQTTQTAGADPNNLTAGWGELASVRSVAGIASLQVSSGQQEAILPTKASSRNTAIVPFDNSQSGDTQIALTNPAFADTATVDVLVRPDGASLDSIEQSVVVGPRSFQVIDLNYLASAAGLRGVATVSSATGFYAAALRFNGLGSTTVFDPLAPPSSSMAFSGLLNIPAVLDGPAYQTAFVLMNTTTQDQPWSLQFFKNGAQFLPDIAGGDPINGVLAPGAWVLRQTAGTGDGADKPTIWAQLNATGVAVLVMYEEGTDGSLGFPAESAISMDQPTARQFLVPFDHTHGYRNVATIINPGSSPATVSVVFRNEDGSDLPDQGSFPLPPLGSVAIDLTQFAGAVANRGVAEFSVDTDVSVLIQRYSPSGTFVFYSPILK